VLKELAGALRRLRPRKSLGLDSILPEFILRARLTLKSRFCDFLISCVRQLKIPIIWRKALIVAIPEPEKPLEDPKTFRPISLLYVPFKILERLIYARVEPIINPLLPQEQAGIRHGKSTAGYRRLPCCHRTRIAFRLRRRLELCLSTSQQPTTLFDIAASPASCCDCYLPDTWFA